MNNKTFQQNLNMFGNNHDISFPDFLTSSSQLFMLSKVTCLSFKRHSNSEVTNTEEGGVF